MSFEKYGDDAYYKTIGELTRTILQAVVSQPPRLALVTAETPRPSVPNVKWRSSEGGVSALEDLRRLIAHSPEAEIMDKPNSHGRRLLQYMGLVDAPGTWEDVLCLVRRNKGAGPYRYTMLWDESYKFPLFNYPDIHYDPDNRWMGATESTFDLSQDPVPQAIEFARKATDATLAGVSEPTERHYELLLTELERGASGEFAIERE
jgi:hypothetical protein